MKQRYFWSFVLACTLSSFCTSYTATDHVYAPVGIGELVDKITILMIKNERITNENKLRHIQHELIELLTIFKKTCKRSPELKQLIAELKQVNEALWEIEDLLRIKETKQEFDDEFIRLARSVYCTNDKRGEIKRAINELLGSSIVEEKEYKGYTTIPSL